MRADDAAGQHGALGAAAFYPFDPKTDETVVDQHLVARLQHFADHGWEDGELTVARTFLAGDNHLVTAH